MKTFNFASVQWAMSSAALAMSSGCIYSNGGSFYLAAVSQPATVYSGVTASSEPQFGFYWVKDQTRFRLADDTFQIAAYTDSLCTTAAPAGAVSLSSSYTSSNGSVSVPQFNYTWPDSRYEGFVYLNVRATSLGVSYCSSGIGVSQRFVSGAGYVASGATGLSGASGTMDDKPEVVFRDSAGHLIVAGYSKNAAAGLQIAVRKYYPNGTLAASYTRGSPGFGGATGVRQYDVVQDGIEDSSGKYVIVGMSANTNSVSAATGMNMIIWRFNSDLTLDTTFNGTGFYTSTGAAGAAGASAYDLARTVAQDSSGMYVIAGLSNSTKNETTIWRIKNDGTPDTTWAGDGSYTHGLVSFTNAGAFQRDNVFALRIDSAGRYLLTGAARNSSNGREVILARFLSTGGLDTTFGTSGYYRSGNTGAGGASGAGTVYEVPYPHNLVDSQGRIWMSGQSKTAAGGYVPAIWRFSADGQPDTTFGGSGYIVLSTSPVGTSGAGQDESFYTMAFDSSNRVVLAGNAYGGGVAERSVIWRLNADGSLDTTFGNGNGYIVRSGANLAGHSGASSADYYADLLIDPFGRYVLVSSASASATASQTVITRMWPDGTLDQ